MSEADNTVDDDLLRDATMKKSTDAAENIKRKKRKTHADVVELAAGAGAGVP